MPARTSIILVLAVVLPGCAIWSLPTADRPPVRESNSLPLPEPQLRVMTGRVPIELEQITPGQYCEFAMSAPPSGDGAQVTHPRVIAGRVVSVDATDVVLTESVSIGRCLPATARKPRLNKVPYVNRLFKTTGIGFETVPIPGELRIPRSSIKDVSSISPQQWPTIRDGEFERIGVDFDFDILVPPQ